MPTNPATLVSSWLAGPARSESATLGSRHEDQVSDALEAAAKDVVATITACRPLTPMPVKPTTVGGVQHPVVQLKDIAPGDLCFQLAPGWGKEGTHHLISAVQRIHTGSLWPLPALHAAGCSVNVVHAAIVVDVDPALGELTLAQSCPPGGLHENVLQWDAPWRPDSHVDMRCRYLFYRPRCADAAADMARVAEGWVAAKAGYDNPGAALAGMLPNRPHHFSRADLLQLARLVESDSETAWPQNAMICSVFVARVWGAVAAARAVGNRPVPSDRRSRHEQRHAVAVGFPCSTLNVLPARLHAAVLTHPDFEPVGVLRPKKAL